MRNTTEFNVLFLGKFLPVQGGVAADAYSLVSKFLDKGHYVEVVSDCLLVEKEFRVALSEKDIDTLLFKNHSNTNNFKFSAINPFGSHRERIPALLPVESLLYGRCIRACNATDFDVIITNYLIPYACVASRISSERNIPHIILHAGSDLFDLSLDPDLKFAIHEAFSSAHAVITTPLTQAKAIELGAQQHKCISNIVTSDWAGPFYQGKKRSNFAQYIDSFRKNYNECDDTSIMNLLETDTFILGVCGKSGNSKGSFELLDALRELDNKKQNIHCIAAWAGLESSKIYSNITRFGKPNNLHLISPMPRWIVPEFINFCDALLFLEHDFWLEFHTPQFPLEIINSGKIGIFSADIFKNFKLHNKNESVNAVKIEAPMNVRNLTNGIIQASKFSSKAISGYTNKNSIPLGRMIEKSRPTLWDEIQTICRDAV